MRAVANMQDQLYRIGAFGQIAYNKAVDGIVGKKTNEALQKAEEMGYKWNEAKGKLEKSSNNSLKTSSSKKNHEDSPFLDQSFNPYYAEQSRRNTGVLRDHMQGMIYNIPIIGTFLPSTTHTNTDYSDEFNKSGQEVAKIALSRFNRAGMLPTEIGVPKLMTDTRKDVHDGGIIDKDFREFNRPYGGGYARPDYTRYFDAALGGRYSFEYGPGGSNLEVTKIDPGNYEVRIFDNNNFDNSTLSETERKNVGRPRLIFGKLIGKGGKKVKRKFTYTIPVSDVR